MRKFRAFSQNLLTLHLPNAHFWVEKPLWLLFGYLVEAVRGCPAMTKSECGIGAYTLLLYNNVVETLR